MTAKEFIKGFFPVLVIAVLIGFLTAPHKQKTVYVTDTVTDTITDWQHDTVYRVDTRVVKLPVHDTTVCIDSLWLTDSVWVEVPISRYRYDTTLTDTHSTTRLTATLSGYEVRFDTLAVSTTVQPIIINETIPWYRRFRPSVGVGIGTNIKGEATAGVYFGIGYLW